MKFKTDRAADVGRLIGGLGRLGRHMAALPQKTEGTAGGTTFLVHCSFECSQTLPWKVRRPPSRMQPKHLYRQLPPRTTASLNNNKAEAEAVRRRRRAKSEETVYIRTIASTDLMLAKALTGHINPSRRGLSRKTLCDKQSEVTPNAPACQSSTMLCCSIGYSTHEVLDLPAEEKQ